MNIVIFHSYVNVYQRVDPNKQQQKTSATWTSPGNLPRGHLPSITALQRQALQIAVATLPWEVLKSSKFQDIPDLAMSYIAIHMYVYIYVCVVIYIYICVYLINSQSCNALRWGHRGEISTPTRWIGMQAAARMNGFVGEIFWAISPSSPSDGLREKA